MSEELKTTIATAPKAFAGIARAVNDTAALVRAIEGGVGIDVKQGDKKIVISLVLNDDGTIPGTTGGGGGAATSLSYSDASITITADGNGVKLTNLATGTYVKMYTTGALGVTNGSTGDFTMIDHDGKFHSENAAGTKTFSFVPNTGSLIYYNAGNQIQMSASGMVVFSNTYSQTMDVNFNDIVRNIALREVDVCDGGVAKKMLVMASAPY